MPMLSYFTRQILRKGSSSTLSVCYKNNFIMMTIAAYSNALGDVAAYFLCIAVLLFAFATVICWYHYGAECVIYLSDRPYAKMLFKFIYVVSVFFGAILSSDIIWEIADFAIGAMTVINVMVICLMSSEVKRETELYFILKKTV